MRLINLFFYEILSIPLCEIYVFYSLFYIRVLSLVWMGGKGGDNLIERWNSMPSFVISGKASTVFRLIELKAKREEAEKALKKQDKKKQKPK